MYTTISHYRAINSIDLVVHGLHTRHIDHHLCKGKIYIVLGELLRGSRCKRLVQRLYFLTSVLYMKIFQILLSLSL